MLPERTQPQDSDDQQRARRLSLQHTRPPGDAPGYQLQRFIGAGAYGEVWVGTDRSTGRRVAVKFYLHRGGVDWTLLTREVEKLVFLSADRYVVQLLEVGWNASPPYYVMEYVENGSLEEWISRQGGLPPDGAVAIFRELAIGLTHAHDKGVLHCDLKPANVLLDQDQRPRLADFGQSRLSHEQSPALGTLFYMAPEQADLKAIPEATWDVYALGALLYCMLTGQPPHRSETLVKRIESAGNLSQRLAVYRQAIRTAPRPVGHRAVPGVDRALANIVDTCLSADPRKRYPNAQSVIEALDARSQAHARRPLLVLGLVGPILLLLITAIFWRAAFGRAVNRSESLILAQTHESNRFAAKFVAKSVESELAACFGLLERELQRHDFLDALRPVIQHPRLGELNAAREQPPPARQPIRQAFQELDERTGLRDFLYQRLQMANERTPQDAIQLASIFVLDSQGTHLAAAYLDPVFTTAVGQNFSWRTYFHGGPEDHEPQPTETPPEPIRTTHLSAPFKSSATETWRVAITAPIYERADAEGRFLGVMGLTINVGDFAVFRDAQQQADAFAVLVDDRHGDQRGTVLQHPLFRSQRPQTDYRVPEAELDRIGAQTVFDYRDPLARAPGGEAYTGDWIVATESVDLPGRHPPAQTTNKTHLLVLVQVPAETTTLPIRQLAQRLTLDAARALIAIVVVILALWYIVFRISRRKPPFGTFEPGQDTTSHSLQATLSS